MLETTERPPDAVHFQERGVAPARRWVELLPKSALLLAGNLALAAAQWLIISMIARLGGAEAVGHYAFALAVATPAYFLTNLALRAVATTDVTYSVHSGAYLLFRIGSSSIALAVLLIVASHWGAEAGAVIAAVALAKGIESLADVVYGLQQRRGAILPVAASLIVRAIVGLLAVLLLLWAAHSVVLAVSGLAAAWLLVFFAIDIPSLRLAVGAPLVIRGIGVSELARLAQVAWPLGAATALVSLNANIPKYFLSQTTGPAAVGAFASMEYFVTAGALLVNSVALVTSPRFASAVAMRDWRMFWRTARRPLAIAAAAGSSLAMLTLAAGDRLLAAAYGEQFASFGSDFRLVGLAAIPLFLGAVLGVGATATRQFRDLIIPYVLVTASVAGVCAIFVPRYGVAGASFGMITAGIGACIAPLYVIRKAGSYT